MDHVPDSPRVCKSRSREYAYNVPITLHPHSPALESALFPCGTLSGRQVRSVSGPSLIALRELQQHPHKAHELRMSVAQHESPEYDLLMLETDGNGHQSCNSGPVKHETDAGGQIVPISMVPSLACIEKECKHALSKGDNDHGLQNSFQGFLPSAPKAKHLLQSSEVPENEVLDRGTSCSRPIQGVSIANHGTEAEHSSAAQRHCTESLATSQQEQHDGLDSGNFSHNTSSNLSETESESLREDSGNTNQGLPTHLNGQVVMGKDGIYCCGGIRQVPASGPGALLPVVDIPGPGSLAAKHCEEVWRQSSNLGITESEETRTASIHSASHRNQLEDTASGKSLSSPRQQRQPYIPQHTDIQVQGGCTCVHNLYAVKTASRAIVQDTVPVMALIVLDYQCMFIHRFFQ